MYCSKCGTAIPDDSVFCSSCGATISNSAEQVTSQPVVQPAQTVPVIMVTPYIGWLFIVLGLIFSIVGLAKRNATKGAAIAGLILSIIGVFIGSVLVLGINAYLNKARAAASSVARQTSSTVNYDTVNAEIDRVL